MQFSYNKTIKLYNLEETVYIEVQHMERWTLAQSVGLNEQHPEVDHHGLSTLDHRVFRFNTEWEL